MSPSAPARHSSTTFYYTVRRMNTGAFTSGRVPRFPLIRVDLTAFSRVSCGGCQTVASSITASRLGGYSRTRFSYASPSTSPKACFKKKYNLASLFFLVLAQGFHAFLAHPVGVRRIRCPSRTLLVRVSISPTCGSA